MSKIHQIMFKILLLKSLLAYQSIEFESIFELSVAIKNLNMHATYFTNSLVFIRSSIFL